MLIVSPTSVSPNWRAEIARFVPHLRVLALTGADRAQRFTQIARSDVVLTTYALLQRDVETLCAQDWQIAVLDETQAIKNPRSKGAQAAGRLRAAQRLALTGTPMENHLGSCGRSSHSRFPDCSASAGLRARVQNADREAGRHAATPRAVVAPAPVSLA